MQSTMTCQLSLPAFRIHIGTSWLGQMAGGVFIEGGVCARDKRSWIRPLSTGCSLRPSIELLQPHHQATLLELSTTLKHNGNMFNLSYE